MYTRPKPSETDDDLLRLQDEFFRDKNENRIKPAATVVATTKKEPETIDQQQVVDVQEQIANTFEAIPSNDRIGTIVERTESHTIGLTQLKFNKRGFPQAKRRDAATSGNNGSIFAQNIKKLKPSNIEPMQIDCGSNTENLPDKSCILTGLDRDEIHQENLRKLQNMSQDEIKEERERLLTTLDPAIIAYLKSKRQQMEQNNIPTNRPTIKQQNEIVGDLDVANELIQRQECEKWLNFDVIETNKLAWMKNIEIPEKIDKHKSFEARFDFDGWLLPYKTDEITEKSRILYHHGDESGRPGYTLQELIHLARSNVLQQKIIALNTIANILALQSTGIYDDIIDIPIEQLFFVLRFCLDDNTPFVINACMRAMRNLIFNRIDEICLDCLLGFGFIGQIQPLLFVDNVIEDDVSENDQQLAEKNLIRCLLRTDILTRIRYIINTIQPATIETNIYCLEILIRLARDSVFVTQQIYQCNGLIKSIIERFIPKTVNTAKTDNAMPLLQAVKLLRILSCRNREYAREFIEKYSIMDSILMYLSSQTFAANTNGLRLQIECYHLWSTFIHYGFCTDHFGVFQPVLMETLNYHYNNTNLEATFVRHAHISGLLNLIGNVGLKQSIQPFNQLITQCFIKWLKQFIKIQQFQCGKLQIISAIFYCLNCWYQSGIIINDTLQQLIVAMLQSKGFEIVTQTIKNGSMLLNNYETHQTTANLKTLQAAAWHTSEHIVPIIQTNSCLPFLCSLSTFIESSNNNELKLLFLTHVNITNYINELIKSDKYYLTNNWFTRIENFLIMNILKCCKNLWQQLDTFNYYQLAVKCTSTFNYQQKQDIESILINIVFNPQFYPTDALMRNLDIRNDSFELSLKYLDEIKTVYVQVLGLQKDIPDFAATLCLDSSIGNIIPIDWIYTPIILLYQRQLQQQHVEEHQQIFIVKNCLRWILIYETIFPELMATTINPTDYYCRIACTFLLSDSLFLIKEIHDLLDLCLINLIRNCESIIDFNQTIHGLNNFQDFYKQLLEQYQSVSYGDVVFGNFILVPLVQRHDVKWRKILWSEYLGVAEIFNTTPQQSICSLELFLKPKEQDVSLLKCYRMALVNNSVRKQSILYFIAEHHVKSYIARLKQKK